MTFLLVPSAVSITLIGSSVMVRIFKFSFPKHISMTVCKQKPTKWDGLERFTILQTANKHGDYLTCSSLSRRRERAIGDISRSNSHSQINRQWRAYWSVEAVNQWTKPLTPLSLSDTAPIISYLETVANRAAEQSFHSKRSIKSGFMQARSRYSSLFLVIALTVFTRRPRSVSVLTIIFHS